MTDALEHSTSYEYTGLGELESWTDAMGRTTRLEYDQAGHRTARVLPMLQREEWTHGLDGKVETHRDFMGRLTVNHHDAFGRLERVEHVGALASEEEGSIPFGRTGLNQPLVTMAEKHWIAPTATDKSSLYGLAHELGHAFSLEDIRESLDAQRMRLHRSPSERPWDAQRLMFLPLWGGSSLTPEERDTVRRSVSQ